MKMIVYIHNPEAFINGDMDSALSIMSLEMWDMIGDMAGRIYVDTIEVDVDSVSRVFATQSAVKALDERETEIRAKAEAEINLLEQRKANLLSLPAPEQS